MNGEYEGIEDSENIDESEEEIANSAQILNRNNDDSDDYGRDGEDESKI